MGCGVVYFARFGDRIKIGFSRTPRNRLRDLGGIVGVKGELLCSISPADDMTARTLEKALHERFHSFALGGEWFRTDPILVAFCAEVRAQVLQPMDEPAKAVCVRGVSRALWTQARLCALTRGMTLSQFFIVALKRALEATAASSVPTVPPASADTPGEERG